MQAEYRERGARSKERKAKILFASFIALSGKQKFDELLKSQISQYPWVYLHPAQDTMNIFGPAKRQ
jgi:hypothetical protein